MEVLGVIVFAAIVFGGGWLLVRYMQRLQNITDRRYPESTDDGRLGGGY